MSGGTAKERAVAELLGKLSGGRGHVRVEDAAKAAYAAGRKVGIEEAAGVASKAIGATRHEIAAEIRRLADKG